MVVFLSSQSSSSFFAAGRSVSLSFRCRFVIISLGWCLARNAPAFPRLLKCRAGCPKTQHTATTIVNSPEHSGSQLCLLYITKTPPWLPTSVATRRRTISWSFKPISCCRRWEYGRRRLLALLAAAAQRRGDRREVVEREADFIELEGSMDSSESSRCVCCFHGAGSSTN